MHVVEVWIEGVPKPFCLQFDDPQKVDAVRKRIGDSASALARGEQIELSEEPPFVDDLGKTLGFRLSQLKALWTYVA